MRPRAGAPVDALWYKDAIIYELRVRSFYDNNGDGIGDFEGLEAKLDYLQSLGVTAIWLLPFFPSPLRDDGYDISSYTDVHPDCGTIQDFRGVIREAHRRGLRVIIELVINHTSDQHEWFQRARRASPGSAAREFYVWSDTSDKYKEARIIFTDSETSNWTWDPVAKAYYWHRFYSHQPDLNFDNPTVRREIMRIADFWLGMGVDGLRLDAVPYLFERAGTSCENLPETHAFLRDLRAHIDRNYTNRMLLAEANQWPEDAVQYFAEGKECHMAFHFPIMPRMFMSLRMEDRFPLTDIWAQTPVIDPTCQWALFLRNHDELTLEMVTDEERDYMYRAYAQDNRMRINLGIRRRLAPLLRNNRRSIELINGLLLSLPGTPVLYYGDEIAMGDNIFLGDRNGVRTPMQWSGDRNAGFSRANPQQLILPVVIDYEYHYQTVNVEGQEANPHSLLWWMRRLIALRRRYKAFGRGSMEFLTPENPRIVAFVRSYDDENILVVANLSRFVQYVELDLSRFKGQVPMELFGQSPFPPIGDLPYLLTLGPHGFIWFTIERPRGVTGVADLSSYVTPQIELTLAAEGILRTHAHSALSGILPRYLPHCRWFRGKARTIRSARIGETVTCSEGDDVLELTLVEVSYADADPETYVLPLGIATGDRARALRAGSPQHIIADVRILNNEDGNGVLYDATANPQFGRALLEMIRRKRRPKSQAAGLTTSLTRTSDSLLSESVDLPEPHVLKAEQSNTSIVFGDRLLLKLFRKLEPGVNPDIEIGRFLTDRARYTHTPPLAGWLNYAKGRAAPGSIALLQGFVPNQGDAWEFTCKELERYLEAAATRSENPQLFTKPLVEITDHLSAPDLTATEMIGTYLEAARLIGQRVAELHLAFLIDLDDPNFAPEPYSSLYQRSQYQSMRNLLGRVMRLLNTRLSLIPQQERKAAQQLCDHKDRMEVLFETFLQYKFSIVRTRTHGDLHLGQMLYTGKDFFIIDFEGEPARPLDERRRKRSPLRDVGGMLRSFEYAAFSQMARQLRTGVLGKADFASLEPWVRFWQTWTSWAFLRGYLTASAGAPYLPKTLDELQVLLDTFTLEKAVYELGYELDNRPEWVFIPLHGITRLVGLPGSIAENESRGAIADTSRQ
jgi:maltose alpha-D-glucosyltransferase/alpha-amylase